MLSRSQMKWRYFKAFSKKFVILFTVLGFVDTVAIRVGGNTPVGSVLYQSLYLIAATVTTLLMLYTLAAMIELITLALNKFHIEMVQYEEVIENKETGKLILAVKSKKNGKLFRIPATAEVIDAIKNESMMHSGEELILLYQTIVFKRSIWIDAVDLSE